MATQNIIDVQIPALKDLCTSGSVSIDNIDVFCEKGVFDTDASRRILKAGQEAGWKVNFHGDELHPMNSGEVRGSDIMRIAFILITKAYPCIYIKVHIFDLATTTQI